MSIETLASRLTGLPTLIQVIHVSNPYKVIMPGIAHYLWHYKMSYKCAFAHERVNKPNLEAEVMGCSPHSQ